MTRFFIIFYITILDQGTSTGHFDMQTGGGFPSLSEIKKYISELFHCDVNDSVVTNIIELKSEQDFNDWKGS